MKNLLLITLLLSSTFFKVNAQWNTTGNSYTTGKVGIGMTPDYMLSVNSGRNGLLVDGNMGGDDIINYQVKFSFVDIGIFESGVRFNKKNGARDFNLIDGFYNGNSLFAFKSNGNVGIGIIAPKSKLHVSSARNGFLVDGIMGGDDVVNYQAKFIFTDLGIAESGIKFNKKNGACDFNLIDGFYNGNSLFTFKSNGSVGIGTSTPGNGYKLDVYGAIHAQSVVVDLLGTADFVFDSTYKLMPLAEVEAFVKENKHLPEIPSAKEVDANGLNIGKMQNKLLQKIEELTLYTIELEKSRVELEKSRNEEIQKREALEARLAKIESMLQK